MKKGISIWSFHQPTLRECFGLARAAGFDGVEVALADDGEVGLQSTEKELIAVKRQAADCGVELYSLASGLYWQYSLTSDDKAMRGKAKAIVRKQLEAAKILGCETILVVPGAVSVSFAPALGVTDYAAAYDRSLEAFAELKGYAEQLQVQIGIENVWNNFLLSPLEMRQFIDAIGSRYVGSYFDVGNVLYAGYPEQWIGILGQRIQKVHFKDYRKQVGSLDGFVDLLAGDVDYPAVMRALGAIGYDGWVTGEMLPPYKHHGDTIIYNTSKAMDAILGRA